jgi:hypothetical protein
MQDIQLTPCSSIEYIHYPVIAPTYNDFSMLTKCDLPWKSLFWPFCWIIANEGAAVQLVEVETVTYIVHDKLTSCVVDGRMATVLCQFILRTVVTLLTLQFRLLV